MTNDLNATCGHRPFIKDRREASLRLRRISPLSFIPLEPYPARSARHLPHAGKAYKVSQSPVIPLISGEWIVSHMWHEILRLSPHLFWLGLFTHRAFSSAQDDDARGRKGSHLEDTLHFLELAVLYYDTSSPLL